MYNTDVNEIVGGRERASHWTHYYRDVLAGKFQNCQNVGEHAFYITTFIS